MATKPKKSDKIDHPGLEMAVSELKTVKGAISALEEKETELKNHILDTMAEFEAGKFIFPSGLGFTVYESHNSRINRTRLLEAGVLPEVVDACETTTEYRAVRDIKQVEI
jgi:hypothetical protein